MRLIRFFALLLVASLAAVPPARSAEPHLYRLATASTGGTFYPVGVALATLVKVKLTPTYGIDMDAITSAGSAENVRLLEQGTAQFAILQGLYGHYAHTGKGPFAATGPAKTLRAVTMLWPNVEQFAVRSEAAHTGTVADLLALQGKPMALGQKTSGALTSNRLVLGNLGLRLDGTTPLIDGGYMAAAQAVTDGRAVAMGTPGGLPTTAVASLMAGLDGKAVLLNFTPDQARQADGGLGLWHPYTIPAGTYPGQTEAVHTIAQPNFLAVRADVDAETVYRLTKAIYGNLAMLRAIHPATGALGLERAVKGIPLPLHPGAIRFYREAGLEVPGAMATD